MDHRDDESATWIEAISEAGRPVAYGLLLLSPVILWQAKVWSNREWLLAVCALYGACLVRVVTKWINRRDDPRHASGTIASTNLTANDLARLKTADLWEISRVVLVISSLAVAVGGLLFILLLVVAFASESAATWAVAGAGIAAFVIRRVVCWVNRRDDPRSAALPPSH